MEVNTDVTVVQVSLTHCIIANEQSGAIIYRGNPNMYRR